MGWKEGITLSEKKYVIKWLSRISHRIIDIIRIRNSKFPSEVNPILQQTDKWLKHNNFLSNRARKNFITALERNKNNALTLLLGNSILNYDVYEIKEIIGTRRLDYRTISLEFPEILEEEWKKISFPISNLTYEDVNCFLNPEESVLWDLICDEEGGMSSLDLEIMNAKNCAGDYYAIFNSNSIGKAFLQKIFLLEKRGISIRTKIEELFSTKKGSCYKLKQREG